MDNYEFPKLSTKSEYFKENAYTFLIWLFSIAFICTVSVGIDKYIYYGYWFFAIPGIFIFAVFLLFYFGNKAYKNYLKSQT